MDLKAVPKYLIGQVGHQGIVLPSCLVVLHGLTLGHKSDVRYVRHRLDLRLQRTGLLLCVSFIHISQENIFRFQITQHVVQVDCNQGERPHNQQTSHDHTYGSKRHKPMGKNRVDTFAAIISQIKFFRHCSTHPFRH